jgi:hypothetical protein
MGIDVSRRELLVHCRFSPRERTRSCAIVSRPGKHCHGLCSTGRRQTLSPPCKPLQWSTASDEPSGTCPTPPRSKYSLQPLRSARAAAYNLGWSRFSQRKLCVRDRHLLSLLCSAPLNQRSASVPTLAAGRSSPRPMSLVCLTL